jgi:lysine 6-dehydrogenase
MRILVLGVGKQGSVLVQDLIETDDVSEVIAGDIDIQRLKQCIAKVASEKVRTEQIDVTNHAKLVKLIKGGFDVVANALPWTHSFAVAEAAVEAGVNYVDLGPSPDVFQLDGDAKAAGITVIPSCGLDPGIDSVLEGYGARKLDKVEKILMWCGGIPKKNTSAYNNPLRYKISWWWEGVISTYCGTTEILRNDKIVEVEKLAGPKNPEVIRFPEPVGECEAFYTGAPLLLIDHLGLKGVKEAWSKTVRWPGHCEIWRKLIALGFTRTDLHLKIRGCKITPREFLIELGEKTLQYEEDEGDIVILRVHVIGEKNGEKTTCSYDFMDFYDKETGITAMARTTSYPCSIVAQMIARGDIKEKGVIHAGKIGWQPQLANSFFSELKKRNIQIHETVRTKVFQ